VFSSAAKAKVKSIVNTSSACAYPIGLQHSETSRMLLDEASANFSDPDRSFPDGAYGWTKLIGEYQLATICSKGSKTKGRSARVFTAYGERENESHAAIALVAKSMLGMDPFPIWGSGQQTRNFTYVSDTITGLMLMAADSSESQFDVFNVGTQEHVTVFDLVKEIHRQLSFEPTKYEFQTDKPAGVGSRAASNAKVRAAFNWEPAVDVSVGIKRTIDWYLNFSGRVTSVSELDEKLNAR
jgi:UDP-glucose 4-epimerase